WEQLGGGGRLVAEAVTLQSETAWLAWREGQCGGRTRCHVAHAQPLGEFDTWRQAWPSTLLDVVKPGCAKKPPNSLRHCAVA
ncbi:hypothetical protein EWW49_35235, partial [Pseudomonas syringae]